MQRGVVVGRGAAAVLALAPLLSAVAGCHKAYSERLIRGGITGENRPMPKDYSAPEWVRGELPHSGGEVFFVGRSVSYNVLDERAAVAAAREDALQQFAQLISTRVVMRSRDLDARSGGETGFVNRGDHWFTAGDDQRFVRMLPGPELAQAVAREASLFTSGIAGDLVQRDVHFEQWGVTEDPTGAFGDASRGMIRYKCWVLMSIPRARLAQRLDDFRNLVADAYERFVQDRERMLTIANEDRQLRIKREEEARLWAREDQLRDYEEARELRKKIMAASAGVTFRVSGGN